MTYVSSPIILKCMENTAEFCVLVEETFLQSLKNLESEKQMLKKGRYTNGV